MTQRQRAGIYIHWPFCASKCPYCDFNSHVRAGGVDQDRYLAAYKRELEYYAHMMPDREIVSVFFGGGTPSLMNPETVGGILSTIQRLWRVSNQIEVTLEANPTSVESSKFFDFRAAGVNRVSLGVQALNNQDLQFLGRQHDVDQAIKAIEVAAHIFERYSFDLIYARPHQTLQAWEEELKRAIPFSRGHLSLYQLTIERNTPFYMRYHRGEFSLPDEVVGAEFYHLTQDITQAYGVPAYEVSNHAAAEHESIHNMLYWNYDDYIGVGAGAHGRFLDDRVGQKIATRDHAAPEKWLELVEAQGYGTHPYERILKEDMFAEGVMMGLRLYSGLDISKLEAYCGVSRHDLLDDIKIGILVSEGWAVTEGEILRLTREGMLRLNAIVPFILKDTTA